jgi:hypothetical protein
MRLEEYIEHNKFSEQVKLKYLNYPFQVWEMPDCFLLIWDNEIIKELPKH